MISFEENKLQATVGDACQESLREMAFKLRHEQHEPGSPVKKSGVRGFQVGKTSKQSP